MEGKIIILSAPSGCGKSTIIKALMERGDLNLRFSVSATNRPPRVGEINGIHYHFLSDEEFRSHIKSGDFVEHEEVYPGRFYGTLRSEIDSILASGHNCILDIDVEGALNVKKYTVTRQSQSSLLPPRSKSSPTGFAFVPPTANLTSRSVFQRPKSKWAMNRVSTTLLSTMISQRP